MIRYIIIALGALAPAIARADDGAIIVTGRALEATIGSDAYDTQVIGRERLTGDASARLEDVLGDVAGFQQFRRSDSRSANPSAQGATLRGLGGNATSRALVLLDGVPEADPFFGYIPFSALVPDRLSSVRITRGGGIGPFGAGAVAGTIELTSAERSDLPRFAAAAFLGSANASDLSASVSPDLGGGYATVSARWERGDGFSTTPESQRVATTVPARYADWSTSLRAVAPLGSATELQARGLIFDDRRTLRFAGADSRSQGADASVRIIHRGNWQVDTLAYLQARNFSNVVISSTSFRKTLDQRNTPSTGIGGKIELRPPVSGEHALRFGGDIRLADGELFEDGYSGVTGAVTVRRNAGGMTSTAGVFAEDDWTLGALVLTGGGRIDRWTIRQGFFTESTPAGVRTTDRRFPDRQGWEGSGRVGAALTVNPALSLRAAAYTGFRLPTLNELYRPFTVFPILTLANDALALEKLKGVEAGLNLTPLPGMRLGATVFYNRLGDAIANVTIGPNLRQRQNVDAIVAKGAELSFEARLARMQLTASYVYTDSTVHASGASAQLDGLRPAQTPRHAGSATLAWNGPSGVSASATLRYTGAQFEDDLQTNILPHAWTVDGTARLPVGKVLAIVVRAENILNEKIVTRNSGGSIDLGTPQTLWVGISIVR